MPGVTLRRHRGRVRFALEGLAATTIFRTCAAVRTFVPDSDEMHQLCDQHPKLDGARTQFASPQKTRGKKREITLYFE